MPAGALAESHTCVVAVLNGACRNRSMVPRSASTARGPTPGREGTSPTVWPDRVSPSSPTTRGPPNPDAIDVDVGVTSTGRAFGVSSGPKVSGAPNSLSRSCAARASRPLDRRTFAELVQRATSDSPAGTIDHRAARRSASDLTVRSTTGSRASAPPRGGDQATENAVSLHPPGQAPGSAPT